MIAKAQAQWYLHIPARIHQSYAATQCLDGGERGSGLARVMVEASASGSWIVERVHGMAGSPVIPFGENMEVASTAVSRRDFSENEKNVLAMQYAVQ